MSNWEGIPNNIDAAAQIGDVSYFFKDGKYWRFDDEKYKVRRTLNYNHPNEVHTKAFIFQVKESNPGYPRSTAQWWFGCNKSWYVILIQ